MELGISTDQGDHLRINQVFTTMEFYVGILAVLEPLKQRVMEQVYGIWIPFDLWDILCGIMRKIRDYVYGSTKYVIK